MKSLFLPDKPEPKLKTVPTVGQNVSTITLPDMYMKIWDVGGQLSLRKLWQSYYTSCHAIVFIIDSTDIGDGQLDREESGRLDECRLVLEDVLHHDVSPGNILINIETDVAFLNDWDLAKYREELVKGVVASEPAGVSVSCPMSKHGTHVLTGW